MAKKQTEVEVNSIAVDKKLITKNAGPQSNTRKKVLAPPPALMMAAGVLKPRH